MDAQYPVGPRVLAAVGAAGAGASFGVVAPRGLLASGHPLTAVAMVATVAPLVALLAWLAVHPASLQRVATRWTRLDLRDAGHVGAAILMAGTLYFVIGYGSIVSGVFAYESTVVQGEPLGEIDGEALFQGLALNLIVLTVPPLVYVSFVGGTGPRRALHALGLRSEGAARAILIGCGSALAAILLIAVVSAAFIGFEVEVPENEVALQIAKSVTVLGAFAIAAGAAVSEEVFFRGFLQPRIGLVAQAVVFSLAHLSYVSVLEIVVTFALALVFGLIYRMTGNLWAPMAGHFLFNLIMLLAGIYAPETASLERGS